MDGGPARERMWVLALVPSPRMALLIGGTLAQTAAFTAWLAAPAVPSGALVAVAGLGFLIAVALFVIACSVPPGPHLVRLARSPAYRLATAPLVVALALSLTWTLALSGDLLLRTPFDPRVYASDAASFTHFNADLVLHRENPYTADGRFWQAVARFPQSAATPLRRGAYAQLTWAPSFARVRGDLAREVVDPSARHGEFAPESLHSYPALAFLAFVPVIWVGAGSTLPLSLIAVVALFAMIGRRLPREQRVFGTATLLANSVAVLLTLRGSFEVLAVMPVLLAWLFIDRPRASPVLLGLACAVKQTVWFLAPIYLLLVARREGPRQAMARGGLALAAFLAPNAPFILADPSAWARSMALPVTLPTFPDGIGLVGFSRTGLLPVLPIWVYGALQLAALAGIGVWIVRASRPPRPELVLLLGSLLLALGWRSLTSYFIWLPAVAIFAARSLLVGDGSNAATGEPMAAVATGA